MRNFHANACNCLYFSYNIDTRSFFIDILDVEPHVVKIAKFATSSTL